MQIRIFKNEKLVATGEFTYDSPSSYLIKLDYEAIPLEILRQIEDSMLAKKRIGKIGDYLWLVTF